MTRFDDFWLQAKLHSLSSEQKERGRARLNHYRETESVRNGVENCLGDMHSEKFWTLAKSSHLSPDRKDVIRGRLHAYMQPREEESKASAFTWFAFQWKVLTGTITAVFCMSTLGLSYAAESAVPGDVLYPMKVSITEPVLSVFVLTEHARARWQVRLAERRLQEEHELLSEGTLTGALLEEMDARVASRVEFASETLEILAEEHPEEAKFLQDRLEIVTSTHDTIIDAIFLRLENKTPLIERSFLRPESGAVLPQGENSPELPVLEKLINEHPTERPVLQKIIENRKKRRGY